MKMLKFLKKIEDGTVEMSQKKSSIANIKHNKRLRRRL